jgi:dolichol-phosphate mannosyltransferase
VSVESSPELMIVMPVYNERASVRKVITEWFPVIESQTRDFAFLALDDGSKDGTWQVLESLREEFGPRLEIVSHANRGHGQTCLMGYRMALARGASWIFQIDSDGQCDPQFFPRVWQLRAGHDVIYGVREKRDDGWRRVVASRVLRLTLAITCGVDCADANVPYRLMRSEALREVVDRIKADFFLANVALAVLLRREGKAREARVPIRFRERHGGEPSVRLGKSSPKPSNSCDSFERLWASFLHGDPLCRHGWLTNRWQLLLDPF